MLTKSSLVYSVLWYNRTMVRMLTSSGEGHVDVEICPFKNLLTGIYPFLCWYKFITISLINKTFQEKEILFCQGHGD